MAKLTPGWGIGLFEVLHTPDTETAQSATSSPTFPKSFYSQTGPGPGEAVPDDPLSRWQLNIRGEQSVPLSMIAIRSGPPRINQGMAVAYRLAADTEPTDYRGWDPPQTITDWTSPAALWGTWDAGDNAIAVDPTTGIVVCLVGNLTAALARIVRYDPRTATWDTGYTFQPPGTQSLDRHRAMAFDPEVPGRLLMWHGRGDPGTAATLAYYSDDLGDTWTIYSVGCFDDTVATTQCFRVAVAAGVEWCAIYDDRIWYSDDRGSLWQVSEDITGIGGITLWDVVRVVDGYLVGYLNGSGHPCVRYLTSARSSFAEATEIELDATACASMQLAVDDDGKVYAFAGVTSSGNYRLYASNNNGENWRRQNWSIYRNGGSASAFAAEVTVAAGSGSLWFLGRTSSSGGTAPTSNDMHLLRLGGWTNVEVGPGLADNYQNQNDRVGWGPYLASSTVDIFGSWLPFDVPNSAGGWTRVSAGGTRDLTVEPGMRLSTAGGAAERYQRTLSTNRATHVGHAKLRIIEGGPAVGSAALPTSAAQIECKLADGVYTYEAHIRLGSDGLRVVDAQTAPHASRGFVSLDGTVPTHVRWHMTLGGISVWYRQGAATKWTEIALQANLTDGGASTTNDEVTWGHTALASAATESFWQLFGAAAGGSMHYGIDDPTDLDLSPSDGIRGLRFGRRMPPSSSYPIPEATGAAEGLGYLSAAGIAYAYETAELPVEYTHGITEIYPTLSPSPSAFWEAEQGANDESIAWDLTRAQWRGNGIVLVVANARASTVRLELDSGGGAWTMQDTLDLAEVTDAYKLVGDWLYPGVGASAPAGRYYRENELAGGWVAIPTTGGTLVEHREIAGNTAGFWSVNEVQQLRIKLADLDGSEDSTGTATIYHHTGFMVVYPSTEQIRRYANVVFEDLAVDNAIGYRAGMVAVGRVVAVGPRPGWDWTKRLDLNRTLDRAPDGNPVVQRLGPTHEVWTYAWQDGANPGNLADEANNPDYIGIVTGLALGSQHNVLELWQHVDGAMRSGEVPCILIPDLPATSGVTVTDPRLFLIGRASADSYLESGLVGNEGEAHQWSRATGITVEQLR